MGELSDYRELSKSGIVFLVLINVVAGYLIGHHPDAEWSTALFLWTLAGIFFLSAGSAALNQLQEWKVDAAMPRTANRPLPAGRITPTQATIFVIAFLLLGLGILFWKVSLEVFWLGVLAVASYNGLYTLWWKRYWAYAAVPGAIPGALPVLMGFVASSHELFSPGGIYLFFILFYWQMPHFWVLALRYQADYSQGQFPTLPVAKGEGMTVHQIMLWCLGYVGLALVAPFFFRIGAIYLLIALPLCIKILFELRHFKNVAQTRSISEPGNKAWLRFFLWINFSQMIFLFAIALDLWAPQLLAPIWTR